jgi:hypothetical protein
MTLADTPLRTASALVVQLSPERCCGPCAFHRAMHLLRFVASTFGSAVVDRLSRCLAFFLRRRVRVQNGAFASETRTITWKTAAPF